MRIFVFKSLSPMQIHLQCPMLIGRGIHFCIPIFEICHDIVISKRVCHVFKGKKRENDKKMITYTIITKNYNMKIIYIKILIATTMIFSLKKVRPMKLQTTTLKERNAADDS
jgi:hypothetical protein